MSRQVLPALALILIVLGLQWSRTRPPPLVEYDQPFYLGIAFDLVHHGRFTDGYRFAGGDDRTKRPPGMRFAPLYPALLAGAERLDPAMRADADCLVATGGARACGRAAAPVRGLQFAMLVLVALLVWWQAAECAGCVRAGWCALGLLLLCGPVLLRSVDTLMTEMTALCLGIGAEALALRALVRAQRGCRSGIGPAMLGAGLLAGLATLCRPGNEPLGLGLCGVAVAASLPARLRRSRTRFTRAVWWFAPGFGLPLLPWMVRNAIEFGRFALTFGYASHTFVQRLSFDAMTGREWGMAFLCWLPDGSGLGRAVAGTATACDRFGWDEHPNSFYSIGLGPMLRDTLAASGGWAHHFGYLVRTYLLAHPLEQIGWYGLVTVPLAMRGLAIDHWWGIGLALCCVPMMVRAAIRRDAGDRRFLLLALPAFAGLLLNAALAVNQPRYNLLLVLPFAVAGGTVLARVSARVRRQWGVFSPARSRFPRGRYSAAAASAGMRTERSEASTR